MKLISRFCLLIISATILLTGCGETQMTTSTLIPDYENLASEINKASYFGDIRLLQKTNSTAVYNPENPETIQVFDG